jgi:anti-sigma B factor antagonist
MNIQTRTIRDILILDLSGDLKGSEEATTLHNAIREALKSGVIKIVINLSDLNFFDDLGFGALISGYTVISNQGRSLKFVISTKKIRKLFLKIKGPWPCLPVVDSEQAAIEYFTGWPPEAVKGQDIENGNR